jgi:hypothetical protein
MSASTPARAEPLLRTLSPALRQLERGLRTWLDAPHQYPLGTITRATLEGLAADLARQADALDMDRPRLVVLLMGGTGVGKSTLLNALASGAIAESSFVRPTTRDAVVYHHDSVRPERLDLALRHCRLAPHGRPALQEKILVDTPDLDSNDLENREKLRQLLPVADVVLYVGSQEKYHDRLGWDLFVEHRRRRAFAFVLNKWDRCVRGDGGVRPDVDLLRDLREEGFEAPLLFRTCAQYWEERANGTTAETSDVALPPEGEQFTELVSWLEEGLSRLEIEAIKARGVGQLLQHLIEALEAACPPDLAGVASKTRAAWQTLLGQEMAATVEVLLNTLEPYQRDIEQHFALEGQRRFRGLMGGYLRLYTRAKHVGSSLRDRIPLLPRPAAAAETPASWDLATFAKATAGVAGDRHLDARGRALPNRLLVAADQQGFPLDLLAGATEAAAKLNWRQRYAQDVMEILERVEQERSRPTGVRRWVQTVLVWLADWLPPLAFLAACVRLLWRYFMTDAKVELFDVLLPVVVLLVVLIILHIFIVFLLPHRWPAIRGDFRRRLEQRVHAELEDAYAVIPGEVAEALRQERRLVEKQIAEAREVLAWLEQREQAASIAGLYGK